MKRKPYGSDVAISYVFWSTFGSIAAVNSSLITSQSFIDRTANCASAVNWSRHAWSIALIFWVDRIVLIILWRPRSNNSRMRPQPIVRLSSARSSTTNKICGILLLSRLAFRTALRCFSITDLTSSGLKPSWIAGFFSGSCFNLSSAHLLPFPNAHPTLPIQSRYVTHRIQNLLFIVV